MKRTLLFLVLVCLFFIANAQRSTQGREFLKEKCQPRYLSSFGKKKNTSSAIKDLEVVDFRPDTSRMGFLTKLLWKDIRFRTSLRQELHAYLNGSYAHAGGTQSLLIIVKKCWLFDTVVAVPIFDMARPVGKGRVIFRAEAFLKTPAGFAPYTYLDTVVTSPISAMRMAHKTIPALLAVLMEKVTRMEESEALSRNRYYSRKALDSMNKRRFAYPMDTALVLRKGVYASLEEFKNNQPSILNYQVEKTRKGIWTCI